MTGLAILFLIAAVFAGLRGDFRISEDTSEAGQSLPENEIRRLLTAANFFELPERGKSPDFSLMSLEGDQVRLSQYRGKVVLLSFWATW